MRFACRCRTGKKWRFTVTSGTTFRKGSGKATFSDLAPGKAVTIRYHAASGRTVADEVDISP
jgi:hypothetical protein